MILLSSLICHFSWKEHNSKYPYKHTPCSVIPSNVSSEHPVVNVVFASSSRIPSLTEASTSILTAAAKLNIFYIIIELHSQLLLCLFLVIQTILCNVIMGNIVLSVQIWVLTITMKLIFTISVVINPNITAF